jgi:hypothetical protein
VRLGIKSSRPVADQIGNELSRTSTNSAGKTLKNKIIQIFENWMEASPEADFFISFKPLSHGVAVFTLIKYQ